MKTPWWQNQLSVYSGWMLEKRFMKTKRLSGRKTRRLRFESRRWIRSPPNDFNRKRKTISYVQRTITGPHTTNTPWKGLVYIPSDEMNIEFWKKRFELHYGNKINICLTKSPNYIFEKQIWCLYADGTKTVATPGNFIRKQTWAVKRDRIKQRRQNRDLRDGNDLQLRRNLLFRTSIDLKEIL